MGKGFVKRRDIMKKHQFSEAVWTRLIKFSGLKAVSFGYYREKDVEDAISRWEAAGGNRNRAR